MIIYKANFSIFAKLYSYTSPFLTFAMYEPERSFFVVCTSRKGRNCEYPSWRGRIYSVYNT